MFSMDDTGPSEDTARMWQAKLGAGRTGAMVADAATWLSLPQPPGGDGSSNKLKELESIWTERTCRGRQGSALEEPLRLPLRESS